jgi:coenzyme PQQ precursor peptide PqqA
LLIVRRSVPIFHVFNGLLGGHKMAWTKPKLVEICVGLEINAYYPAEL